MYFCYLDESGTDRIGAGTSHFVLAGIAIPEQSWAAKDAHLTQLKAGYGLADAEIHTGWMTRRYLEQEAISGFDRLSWDDRREQAARERGNAVVRASALKSPRHLRELKKNYRKTAPYIHLTRDDRLQLLRRLADEVGSWSDARLVGDAIDKTVFGTTEPRTPPFEAAFAQVVSRFESFLRNRGRDLRVNLRGLLIQDNNPTMSVRLTQLMRRFHSRGTPWTAVNNISEVPLFVDSALTSMVQVADLCAYAIRRFLENDESDLFNRVYPRADRAGGTVVGLRHYTGTVVCSCRICRDHRS